MIRNKEFYSRKEFSKKELFKTEIDKWSLSIYVLGSVLVIFIGPFLNKYKRVFAEEEMSRLWIISAIIVIVVGLILVWFVHILPYLEKKGGYYLSGKFRIAKKTKSFTHKYLKLDPGKSHKIKVSDSFYRAVHEGDLIELERTRIGGIRKIRRVTTIRDRLMRKERTIQE